jgi:L-arabinokinase
MWRIDGPGDADENLEEVLRAVERHSDFFDPTRPIALARAPGRLDLMGGIADYSGSLVLELPLGIATWAAVQTCADPTVSLRSTAAEDPPTALPVSLSLDALSPQGGPLDYPAARALLAADDRRAWGAYVAGAIVVLHHALGRRIEPGLRCLVHSTVPIGKGLSSSAALEVASLRALTALLDIPLGGRDLALLAQRIENLVVGAPCGVMDQMTSACGKRDQLLVLLCQPAELEGNVPIPEDLEIWGLDSGIRHAVSGSDYTSVRVATFMGYRIVADAAGFAPAGVEPSAVVARDAELRGYLSNLAPALWEDRLRARVPETMLGHSFLDRYGGLTDPVTRVDSARTYAVRACTEHPIYENQRVRRFRSLIDGAATREPSRRQLGEIMYASHASYSACGLGSDGTDRLVELVRAEGEGSGLYGAKITGGGSGGVVAVLARSGCRPAVERIVAQYARETGRRSAIYGGSSPGAIDYGVRTLRSR